MQKITLDIDFMDIKRELNPNDLPNGFGGVNSNTDQDSVLAKRDTHVAYVISRLPARLQRLVYYIDGEYLAGGSRNLKGGAIGGETEFFTSLKKITNVQLFLNYKGYWANRVVHRDALPASAYTVDSVTGKITLDTPLQQGDILIVTYNHDGLGASLVLRKIALDFIVADLIGETSLNETRLEYIRARQTQSYVDLQRLYIHNGEGKLNIPEINQIDLVNETVQDENSLYDAGYNSGLF